MSDNRCSPELIYFRTADSPCKSDLVPVGGLDMAGQALETESGRVNFSIIYADEDEKLQKPHGKIRRRASTVQRSRRKTFP